MKKNKTENLITVKGNKVYADKLVDQIIKSHKAVIKALAYK